MNPLGVPAHQHPNGGGWVADTATVADSAYIGPEAQVSGHAKVSGQARVFGGARVFGARHTLVIGPVGSEDQYVTFAPSRDGGNVLTIGCWTGTLDGLADEVQRRCPGRADEYALCEALLRHRLAEWEQA